MLTSAGRWTIEHDPAATADYCASGPRAFECYCLNCKNFESALDLAFPPDFRSLTDELGIDVSKYVELAHFGRERSGPHITGGWFHVAGKIVAGRDAWNKGNGDFEKLEDDFEFGFSKTLSLLNHCDPLAFIQLEFVSKVPWVLEEPEPD